ELHLGEGPLEAVLLPEAGARLHRLRAFGHDLLRTPADPALHLREPFFWGGYLMAPWCNRLAPATTAVGSRAVKLDANFADGSAIHGQVAAMAWAEVAPGTCSVRAGGDGWPWPYEVTLSASATGSSLHLGWQLTNVADAPMPAGIGFHPWWLRPVQVRVGAGQVYASNMVPSDEPEPAAGSLNLGALATPAEGLDGTWTDASSIPVELAWPELGLQATLTATDVHYVAVATPPDLDAVAVEPETHAPDGLRRLLDGRSDGLAWLPAGESLALDLEIEVSRG
ncbi:MAG TPA: hypothetical protein VF114_04205, partial [Candidatus Limnocylindria bacterium]